MGWVGTLGSGTGCEGETAEGEEDQEKEDRGLSKDHRGAVVLRKMYEVLIASFVVDARRHVVRNEPR